MNSKLPAFIRRDVERAIEDALHPKGMSTHDGKARIGVDRLQYLLRIIDGTQDDPVECYAEPWLLDTNEKVEWANKRVLFGRTWRLGDHCSHRPAHS